MEFKKCQGKAFCNFINRYIYPMRGSYKHKLAKDLKCMGWGMGDSEFFSPNTCGLLIILTMAMKESGGEGQERKGR